ncbi:MAG: tetratricopeptide repeat protein [Bacteroidota bacterium]
MKKALAIIFSLSCLQVLCQKTTSKQVIEGLIWAEEHLKSNPAQVFDTATSIKRKLKYHSSDSLRARLDKLLGMIYLQLDQFDSSDYYLRQSKHIFSTLRELDKVAGVDMDLGALYRNQGDYENAERSYANALELYKETGNEKQVAIIYRRMAIIKKRQNLLPEALELYLKAIRYADANNELSLKAHCQNGIANIYKSQKQYAKASKLFLQALETYKELDHKVGQTNVLNNIGELYLRKSSYDTASIYFRKAIALNNELGTVRGAGIATYNLGLAQREIGQLDSAKSNFFKSRDIFLEIGDLRTANFPAMGVIEIHKMNNQLDQALEEAILLFNKARQESIKQIAQDISLTIWEIYNEQAKYKEAMEYQTLHFAFKDSLLNEASSQQLVEMETKYDTEKKEQEIQSLSQQNEIKDLQINQQRIVLGASFSVFALLIGVGYFAYRQRKLAYSQKQLVLEQNLLRAQMNPHFIFNALNSIQSFITSNQSNEAILYLAKFGELTRDILEASSENWILWEKERKIIQNYMDLERARFQKELTLDIDIQVEEEEYLLVPPMLIQPFLENAIKHGFKGKEEGVVSLSIIERNARIHVEITDDGGGLISNAGNHRSRAITITNQRLQNISGKKTGQVRVSNRYDEDQLSGVMVTFDLPANYAL